MSKLSLRGLLTVALLAVGMTGVCLAQGNNSSDLSNQDTNWHRRLHAPEIDPASASGALALLAGGLLIIRGRRR
jgi:hypothetical protein